MKFEYKNYKGKRRIREVEIKGIEFGKTPHINDDKWLLVAYDLEDKIEKKFVIENIQRFCKFGEVQRLMCVTTYVFNENNQFFYCFIRN